MTSSAKRLFHICHPEAQQALSRADSPAALPESAEFQRGLDACNAPLFIFELSSVTLLCASILRGAMLADAAIGIAVRPGRNEDMDDIAHTIQRILKVTDKVGYRLPLLLSVGPFALSDGSSQSERDNLASMVRRALKEGATEFSLCPSPSMSGEDFARAMAEPLKALGDRGCRIEVVAESLEKAETWRQALPPEAMGRVIFSLKDMAASEAMEECQLGTMGFRPDSGEVPGEGETPENFRKAFRRLVVDPVSEIALQVLDESAMEEVQVRIDSGERLTDIISGMEGLLEGTDQASVQWCEENTTFFVSDLLKESGAGGSARALVRELLPDEPETDGESAFRQLMEDERDLVAKLDQKRAGRKA